MQTGPRMDAEAIAGTAQILCGRGLTPAWRWGPALLSQMLEVTVRVCLSLQEWRVDWKLIRINKKTARASKRVDVTPLTAPSGRYTSWDFWPERANGWASPYSSHPVVATPIRIFATCIRSGFVLQRATKLKRREWLLRILPRITSKTRATSVLVFARRAAAADVAGDDSRWQQAGNKSKDTGLLTRHNAWRGANGEKCEVDVFRCCSIQSRAACNRRNVNSKSNLPELALLLSARSPVNPETFLIHQKGVWNAPFAWLLHLATPCKKQEKYSAVSRAWQS